MLLKMPLCGFKALTGAPTTAHGIEDLFAIMVQGAEEHPPREAVEASTPFASGFATVCGVRERVTRQHIAVYTYVVHTDLRRVVGHGPGVFAALAGPFAFLRPHLTP